MFVQTWCGQGGRVISKISSWLAFGGKKVGVTQNAREPANLSALTSQMTLDESLPKGTALLPEGEQRMAGPEFFHLPHCFQIYSLLQSALGGEVFQRYKISALSTLYDSHLLRCAAKSTCLLARIMYRGVFSSTFLVDEAGEEEEHHRKATRVLVKAPDKFGGRKQYYRCSA